MEASGTQVEEKIPFTPRKDKFSRKRSNQFITNFDRFIPFRPDLDVDTSHVKIVAGQCPNKNVRKQPDQFKDHQVIYYNQLLGEAMDMKQTRVLPTVPRSRQDSGYSKSKKGSRPGRQPRELQCHVFLLNKHFEYLPPTTELDRLSRNKLGPLSPYALFFNDAFSPPKKHSTRRGVSTWPECAMDMPKLRNDFYTNLLDWGSTNLIAVALSLTMYIWNAETKACQKIGLDSGGSSNSYIASVAWNPEGTLLAIGDNTGEMMICDPEYVHVVKQYRLKEKTPIAVIRWTEDGIFSGTKNGRLYLDDHRVKSHVTRFFGHTSATCGLQKAKGTPYLASGDDDGTVCIWNLNTRSCYRSIPAHKACAKAMSFCPWRNSILATGGGTEDGYIRLWHIHTGQKLGELYTQSQNCSLLWSEEYRELVSSHGTFTTENNDIVLWKMRDFNFEVVARLKQHTARPLHLALSADKTTVGKKCLLRSI